MTHHALPVAPYFIAVGALLVYMVWMMITGSRTLSAHPGSYLVREEDRAMEFRKPEGYRRIFRLYVVLLAFMLVCLLFFARDAANPRPIYFFTVPDGLLAILLLTYLSGPDDVRFDAERRTYQRTMGWPWRPRILSGPFDDFKGICVSPRGSVLLLLRRRELLKSHVVLGGGTGRAAAAALAEKVSHATGLPVVDYPADRR